MFIHLVVLDLSFCVWNLVPQSGIEHRASTLGCSMEGSDEPLDTREVSAPYFKLVC